MTQRQSRRRRARRRRKHGFSTWSLGKKILLVFVIALLLMITVGVVYAADKLGKLEQTKLDTKKLSISDEIDLGDGYTNLALFGLDSRDGELGEGVRSDSIIIASLNNKTKEIKMVSLYRDTLLELEDGSLNKANSAYAFGGPEEAVAMINKNLDLNIEDYIAVNFNALVDVIDALGGMDVTLSDAEVVHMNNYCVETSEVTGKSYTKIEPEVAGTYHLNGVQATSYARIRYTAGGDFERTERQRFVLEQIAESAKKVSFSSLNSIMDKVFPQVATSMELGEMLKYAKIGTSLKIGATKGFPEANTSDTLSGVGSVVIPDSLVQSVRELHEFLFPDLEYEVSSTVTAIDEKIRNKSLDRSDGSDFVEDEVNFYSEPQYYEYGSPEQDVWTGGETQTPDYGTGDSSGSIEGSGTGESGLPGGDGTISPDGGGSDLGGGDVGDSMVGGETGGVDTGTGQEMTQ